MYVCKGKPETKNKNRCHTCVGNYLANFNEGFAFFLTTSIYTMYLDHFILIHKKKQIDFNETCAIFFN